MDVAINRRRWMAAKRGKEAIQLIVVEWSEIWKHALPMMVSGWVRVDGVG